jgi:hypothetical protein
MTDHELNDPALDPTELGEVAPDVQRAFADLVRGVEAGPALRARVERGVRSGPSRLGSLPMRRALAAAAAAAVAVLVGGVAVLGGSGDDRDEVVTVADDPDADSVTSDTPPPTVEGVTITRPEGDGSATTTTAVAGIATIVPSAVVEGTRETTPPTVAPVCRDSFDPACGDFRWDPEPVVGQSTLQMHLPPEAAQVGVPYEVVLELTDPTAPPSFNCADSGAQPSPSQWVGISGCSAEPPPPCPTRFGPWTPPAPQGGTTTLTVSLTFDEPGPHTFSVTTRPPSGGCYQPYGSAAHSTVDIEVLP